MDIHEDEHTSTQIHRIDTDFLEKESATATETSASCSSTSGSSDDPSTASTCSSDLALCDVLGLPSLAGMVMEEEEEEDCHNINNNNNNNICESQRHRHPWKQRIPIPLRIDLPATNGVSRKGYAPEGCLAYEIPNILSRDECLELISVAANSHLRPNKNENENENSSPSAEGTEKSPSSSSSDAFRYITHAVHTAPDGRTKFRVKLDRPNPHKLAVFRQESWVNTLWDRLRPLLLSPRREPLSTSMSSASSFASSFASSSSSPSLSDALRNLVRRESLLAPPVGLNPRLRVLRYDASDKDEFKGHFDATTEVHPDLGGGGRSKTSFLTVLLYLNDGGGECFDGGETEFLSQHDEKVHLPSATREAAIATVATVAPTPTPTPLGKTSGSTNINTSSSSSSSSHHHHQRTTLVTPRAGSVVVFEHDLFHRGRPLEWGTKYVLRTDVLFTDHDPNAPQTPATGVQPAPDTAAKKTNGVLLLSTVEDVLRCTREEWSDGDGNGDSAIGLPDKLLRQALSDGMGFGDDLHDVTIECLCAAGRSALSVMLTEHIGNGADWHHQENDAPTRIVDRFLDVAFEALRQGQ